MKYLTKELKGTYGYIKKQTVFEIIKTAVLFAMAFGIFAIGYYTLGTKKSLWSVFAVLSLLPASKSLVSVIMFLRYRSITPELYSKIAGAAGEVPLLYELIVTTKDKTYFIEALGYAKGSLIAYSSRKGVSTLIEKHITDVLNNAAHKGVTVKIFDDEADFLRRLKELNEHLNTDGVKNTEAIFTTLRAVSL